MSLTITGIMAAAVAAVAVSSSASIAEESGTPAHVRNSFEFTVDAPQSRVAPLFGANGERVWAEDWDPQFLYPQPAADIAGAVFTLHHGDRRAIWITTIFEPGEGRMQHVYVIPDVMTTLIDIRLTQSDPSRCRVSVSYERTALSPHMNEHVRRMGEADAGAGPHWKQAIDAYLTKAAGR